MRAFRLLPSLYCSASRALAGSILIGAILARVHMRRERFGDIRGRRDKWSPWEMGSVRLAFHDDASSVRRFRTRATTGLFSESGFRFVCRARSRRRKILGVDFLDGRVVAYRGENGEARVMSAYCAHVGADLSVGDIQGDTIRCAFHHWRYDGNGVCVATKVGDPPPRPPACSNFLPASVTGSSSLTTASIRASRFRIFRYPDSELAMNVSVVAANCSDSIRGC